MCPIVLSHIVIGDGSFNKEDKRIRIFTNSFTYQECIILSNSINNNCNIKSRVLFDRTGLKNDDQYIITIGRKELKKVQKLLSMHIHSSMIYKIGYPVYN